MEDYSQILQKVSSWSEELLLRGISQFTLRDVEFLERMLEGTRRFQMTFLHDIVEQVIEEGRNMALGNGDEDLLLFHYCRLTQYVQLSVQESS